MTGPRLAAHLSKRYPPDSRHDQAFGRHELTFITNAAGDPVTLFIGERNADGTIRGERYARTLLFEPDTGRVLKSHWDLKGKTARG